MKCPPALSRLADSPVVRPSTAPAASPAAAPRQQPRAFLAAPLEDAPASAGVPAANFPSPPQAEAAAAAEPEWSQEPEIQSARPPASDAAPPASATAAVVAVATSLEGFSDSRPATRKAQSRRDIEEYNRRVAARLKDELARAASLVTD